MCARVFLAQVRPRPATRRSNEVTLLVNRVTYPPVESPTPPPQARLACTGWACTGWACTGWAWPVGWIRVAPAPHPSPPARRGAALRRCVGVLGCVSATRSSSVSRMAHAYGFVACLRVRGWGLVLPHAALEHVVNGPSRQIAAWGRTTRCGGCRRRCGA